MIAPLFLLQAAPVVPIPDRGPVCEARIERVRELGRETSDGTLSGAATGAAITPTGAIVVGVRYPAAPPMIYHPGGTVDSIGRLGRGPLEFAAVGPIVAAGDSLLIVDQGNARVILVRGNEEAATWRVPPSGSHATLVGRHLILDNARLARGFTPRPLWILDLMDGGGTAAGDSVPLPGNRWGGSLRSVLGASTSAFWVIPSTQRYVIELWDVAGRLLMTWHRQATWYREYDAPLPTTPDRPPQPYVAAAWADAVRSEVLWTATLIEDRRWWRGLGPRTRIEGQWGHPVQDRDAVYDTMLEAVDVSSGRVLAARRLPWGAGLAVGPGLFARHRETDEGIPYLEIWRTALCDE